MLRPLVRTRPRHQRANVRAARVPAGRAQVLPLMAILKKKKIEKKKIKKNTLFVTIQFLNRPLDISARFVFIGGHNPEVPRSWVTLPP
jgi:hypothetical protein